MQLTLDMGATRVPQQALLGSRTTRMIAGDLRDLEHEAAVATTEIFRETGISYPREDLETAMFNDIYSTAAVPPRLELEPHAGHWFPDQTSRIDRLLHERVALLRRLMQKSRAWEQGLADLAGDVSYSTQIEEGWLDTPEGKAAFRTGKLFEVAAAAGKTIESQFGQPGNPWEWLDEDPLAFPNPVFFDAMFRADVDLERVRQTRAYRHMRPWFVDDVDEELVAQWVFDHTGTQPWSGSWMAYQLNGGAISADEWPEYQRVVSAAELVREYRQARFKIGLDPRPRQQHLIRAP